MKATKIAAFVLMGIVALAVGSAIGLTLLSNVIATMGTTASKGTPDSHKVEHAFVLPVRVKGDPIDDPRPNSHRH